MPELIIRCETFTTSVPNAGFDLRPDHAAVASWIRTDVSTLHYEETQMTFDFEAVRDILACPQCRGELICVGDFLICNSEEHRLKFPITDGIPRLLMEESSAVSEEEWEDFSRRQEQES